MQRRSGITQRHFSNKKDRRGFTQHHFFSKTVSAGLPSTTFSSKKSGAGFTIIEVLIVIAIIGILVALVGLAVISSRHKGSDTAIKSSVRQLRILAEEVYDTQGGSYVDWADHTAVASEVTILKTDIAEKSGQSNAATIRQSQEKEYCISAPLRTDSNLYYCVDVTGTFSTASSECPDEPIDGDPLRCP